MSGKQADGNAIVHSSIREGAQTVTLPFLTGLFSWLEHEVGSSYYLSLGFVFCPTIRAVAPALDGYEVG